LLLDAAATACLSRSFPVEAVETPDRGESAEDPLVDAQLGHYRVLAKLGQGGMGAVYRALDESLQRYVALKVLRPCSRSPIDSDHIQRLLQEAIAQARVSHPHVAHIYYVGRQESVPFFAMELVAGPTLAQRLADGPLPFDEVARIALQVVDALRHCARFDIIHGDIKPSNVLLADGHTAKLSDFGLARRISQLDRHPDLLGGTPVYLSPEAADGKALDVRSDMYSLGITLFEMTFGRLPYRLSGSKLEDFIRQHRELPVEFPTPWPAGVPTAWREVLQRLLAKSPADRYPSYDALYADLQRLRPARFLQAGRVQRGLAWTLDLALAHAVQSVFYLPLAAEETQVFWQRFPIARLALALVGGVVPLAAALLQMRWQTTPGKQLFQLRIVDAHGVVPARSTLAVRMLAQILPVCVTTVWEVLAALHLRPLAALVAAVAYLALLADAGWALLSRRGRSLHDRLFGTRVVLKSSPDA
jgi:uncharacterized RDD family membrane protein YckC